MNFSNGVSFLRVALFAADSFHRGAGAVASAGPRVLEVQ
jgi:hypothetical protein